MANNVVMTGLTAAARGRRFDLVFCSAYDGSRAWLVDARDPLGVRGGKVTVVCKEHRRPHEILTLLEALSLGLLETKEDIVAIDVDHLADTLAPRMAMPARRQARA